jgi:hypothetical protein
MRRDFCQWFEAQALSKPDPFGKTGVFIPSNSAETGVYNPRDHETPITGRSGVVTVGNGKPGPVGDDEDEDELERRYPTGYPKGHIFRGDKRTSHIQDTLHRMATGQMMQSGDVRGMMDVVERLPDLTELADIAMLIGLGQLPEPNPEQAKQMAELRKQFTDQPNGSTQLWIYRTVMDRSAIKQSSLTL